jgi:hypothetical protein
MMAKEAYKQVMRQVRMKKKKKGRIFPAVAISRFFRTPELTFFFSSHSLWSNLSSETTCYHPITLMSIMSNALLRGSSRQQGWKVSQRHGRRGTTKTTLPQQG